METRCVDFVCVGIRVQLETTASKLPVKAEGQQQVLIFLMYEEYFQRTSCFAGHL
jgi:hypothetical protein